VNFIPTLPAVGGSGRFGFRVRGFGDWTGSYCEGEISSRLVIAGGAASVSGASARLSDNRRK
jgi:hypothetical protein